MSSVEDNTLHDVLTSANLDFTNPVVDLVLLWLFGACLFNLWGIQKAVTGQLINKTITRQVIIACSLAIVWTSFLIIPFFWLHRVFVVLLVWTGFPLTLIIGLQHIELLKMFVSLSECWTTEKCRKYQLVMVVLHVALTIPCYLWPLGFENNKFMTSVFKTN